ncbi:hypothetical protein NP493_45g06016 [Ridgeia piscesae]|uniref:EF-hand domain-containing protein n=1 Tax=Ridgeia piscesae TaxID=27915 RepID=A0AAD9PBT6_RIDPI|nr:hypothetical protein NP493_45g06016 [Ridgeia piscesae]
MFYFCRTHEPALMWQLIFLGGSCNPTTWRHDVAIPFLKQHGITFYNPQVSNWRPELMEIEDQAKQTAELLFFVVDNQTRSTASMVEAAYLAGCGRQLILVIKDFTGPVEIAGETLSSREVDDLERSHAYLTDLVERQGIPVFSEMDAALKCTAKAIQQGVKVSELTKEDGAQPVKFPHVRVAGTLLALKDAFNAVDTNRSGRIGFADLNLAYKSITNEDLPAEEVLGTNSEKTFLFEDFCILTAEYRYKRKCLLKRLAYNFLQLPRKMADWVLGTDSLGQLGCSADTRRREIFLGGTCGRSTWRQDIAIPILRKHGISFFNPQLREWNAHYIAMEAAVKDGCRLLLYVITADTRGITSMIEVGNYIGQGCNIVLCMQNLGDGVKVENEMLTPTAVKDYNRARTYLADLANRDGVPVFDNIHEAVGCAVQKLKEAS